MRCNHCNTCGRKCNKTTYSVGDVISLTAPFMAGAYPLPVHSQGIVVAVKGKSISVRFTNGVTEDLLVGTDLFEKVTG